MEKNEFPYNTIGIIVYSVGTITLILGFFVYYFNLGFPLIPIVSGIAGMISGIVLLYLDFLQDKRIVFQLNRDTQTLFEELERIDNEQRELIFLDIIASCLLDEDTRTKRLFRIGWHNLN